MTDYQVCGKVSIDGKTRIMYSKTGSTKKYLKHKGRMMNVVNYKKMKANKMTVKPVKKGPKKHGGNFNEAIQALTDRFDALGK